MVIGWLHRELEGMPSSAWALVEASQRKLLLPCLLVPQPAHAVLAGELAAGLLPGAFGELPPEIRRAIQMHDTGWASSDAQQIQRLRGPEVNRAVPVSFVAIALGEAIEAWTASIDCVEGFSKPGALVVSRHFSLLAQKDPASQRFLQMQKVRHQGSDGPLTGANAQLDRWTAALGFCDLLSLYLLSGLSREVELPLAHPASPQAQNAPRVKLTIEGRTLRFTPETFRAGSTVSIQALRHPVPSQGPRAETLTWEVR